MGLQKHDEFANHGIVANDELQNGMGGSLEQTR